MESKYKERAKQLCSSLFEKPCNWEENSIENDFLILMCQLAEEVEKVYKDPLMFGEEGSIQRVYSQAYVEELLEKQRELCDKVDTENTTKRWKAAKELYENLYGELKGDDEENLLSILVFNDENNILNAKLKID
jgi:hypothetical protein